MLKLFGVGVLMLAAASSLVGQENLPRWLPVAANAPGSNACWLAKTDVELEARLRQVGWNDQSHDFPKIDWSKKIAAVVTASDEFAKPRLVVPPLPNHKVVIMLQPDVSHPNSGVLVVELDSGIQWDGCVVEYSGAPVPPVVQSHAESRAMAPEPVKTTDSTPVRKGGSSRSTSSEP